MLLTKFLEIISKFVPGSALPGKEEELAKLNPDKIYIENVRGVLGVSHDTAVRICETAVRQGQFRRGIEVMCPDGTVAASADTEANLPQVVHCWREEDGHIEEVELPTSSLLRITFYRLNDQSAPVLLGQPN